LNVGLADCFKPLGVYKQATGPQGRALWGISMDFFLLWPWKNDLFLAVPPSYHEHGWPSYYNIYYCKRNVYVE
jgi:hypothetical protein